MKSKRQKKVSFFSYSFFSKNHRGSHVGIVLSFIVFVLFLIFLYSSVEPIIKTQKDKQALLDYLEKALVKNFSANLTTSTLSINKDISKNCIEIENLIVEIGGASRIIVKNKSGDITLAYISQSNGNNLLINRNDISENFFKIYSSEEFEELETFEINPCEKLKKEENYNIELVKINENIFKTRIIKFINNYEDNYEDLKEELNVPFNSEFGFGFIDDYETIETKEKEASTDIYAEKTPIQYIDNEANINPGFINIQVW